MPGQPVGVVGLEGPTAPNLITSSTGNLGVYAFDRVAEPIAALRFTLADAQTLWRIERNTGSINGWYSQVIASDFDADGRPDLVTTSADGSRLRLFSSPAGVPLELFSHKLSARGRVLAGAVLEEDGNRRFFLADSGGLGTIFDPDAALASELSISLGGYSATGAVRQNAALPVMGKLGSSQISELLVPNGSGTLEALGAIGSTFAFPPDSRWQRPRTSNPIVLPSGNVACLSKRVPIGNPQFYDANVLDGDGNLLWSAPIGRELATDMIAGDLNADGTANLILQIAPRDSKVVGTLAFNGLDGTELWTHTSTPIKNRQPYGPFLVDWAGGPGLDVAFQSGATIILDGDDGSVLSSSQDGGSYATVTPYNIDADDAPELVLHEGQYNRSVVEHRPLRCGAILVGALGLQGQ